MPEIPDNYEVSFLSKSFGMLGTNYPDQFDTLLTNNIFVLALQSDNEFHYGCGFESSQNLVKTRDFTGELNLLDAFIKGVIIFVRIKSGLHHAIRFYSADDNILSIMKSMTIRFQNADNTVTRRTLSGPFYEDEAKYYQYGNLFFILNDMFEN